MSVICDPKPVETGIIVSSRADRVLRFLETCAGAPEKAISLVSPKHFRRSLRILRGAGYVRRCWFKGHDPLWVPVNYNVPRNKKEYLGRSALGWLAARLVEAGADFNQGIAVFPNSSKFRVVLYPPGSRSNEPMIIIALNGEKPEAGEGLWVNYDELQEKDLQKCLNLL
ncbi:hypothetical protein [Desulfoscipio geothermicus]|uniref:Uncharacterized protein n=1 Tax=Desulfoscipio geothermicus DSM 3669 TaxID=1121426 RepID=A0A1I6E412_9FIRM|nr:hypothetical protein [Desulfoscipio geothermicus]SFR12514.1 hypothetical protein SAMN05660706_12542 [Desulfoscipio geothermicus DSM 3669]